MGHTLVTTKICIGCTKELSLDNFSKKSRNKDGLDSYCRSCKRIFRKKDYDNNREHYIAEASQWKKENPNRVAASIQKNKDTKAQQDKTYRENNKEKLREQKHNYYLTNRDHIRARVSSWKKQNPQKVRAINRNRDSLKRASGNGTRINYQNIIDRDQMICHLCDQMVELEDLHFDHVIPLSKGGSHSEDNVAISHSTCNLLKGSNVIARGWGVR